MFSILLAIQILVSVSIITLVLLQQGKGADMGAGFGSGASGTVFGARGSGSFFTRATAILAAIFFINCLLIASPLVREAAEPDETLAERIEQQEMAESAAAEQAQDSQPPAEDAAPATVKEDLPAVITEQETGEQSDLPGVPAAEPGASVADDLPQ
jgi:preprotein translocase subunit SecG